MHIYEVIIAEVPVLRVEACTQTAGAVQTKGH